jgi:hypothetical protein
MPDFVKGSKRPKAVFSSKRAAHILYALLVILIALDLSVSAQRRRPPSPQKSKPPAGNLPPDKGQTAVVIDETLSLLRNKPSLFSEAIQRMHRGRKVQILGSAEGDGVKFFRIAVPPANFGWVQADAVFGLFRPYDEERLARLMQAATGYDQIEIAVEFFKLYPASKFQPPVLLLFGDLLEEVAAKLTRDAGNKLKRPEMAATGAPLHSYYMNFVSLDRYRKLGITFLFNSSARAFHYDGSSWRDLILRSPGSPEAGEAQKRLESLKSKMERIEGSSP